LAIKKTGSIKRFWKIALRTLLGLILFLLLMGIALSLPSVQTRLGKYITERLNKDYGTDITVDRVAISAFGSVKLKDVLIRDHHKDTLIFSKRIQTNILSFRQLYNGDLLFGDIRTDGLLFFMKIYKGEKDSNLDRFIRLFDTGKKSSDRKFLLRAKNVYASDSRFLLIDENNDVEKSLDLSGINASIKNLQVHGPDVTMLIRKMSFADHRGLYVKQLATDFTYTKKNILLKQLSIRTEKSTFDGDVALRYVREDFLDFSNKVLFDIKGAKATIATNDIRYFYKEIGKDILFIFSSDITGTLNNFTATNLALTDSNFSEIKGTVNFRNLLGNQDAGFYMKGNFDKVSSQYKDLVALLPNILGKKLPTSLRKLGMFNLRGKVEITMESISSDFYMTSALGNIQSNLAMTNIDNIDNASYNGYIILENFNLGKMLDRTDVGTVTLNVDVDGKGFTEKYLNTSFSGDVYRINYNGYNYSNIVVNGNLSKPVFKGSININDPNLFMDFDGLVNLAKKDMEYDFHAKIDYANLVKLKLMKNDTVSVFKGDIRMQVKGNTLDNMEGNVYITQTSYQNNRDTYIFDDFKVTSAFDENRIRTITINSPDIIHGTIVGQFEFGQVPKMVENSLGSLYANYSPNTVKKGQFMKFDFTVYNKIIEIFYPGISLGQNTVVNGNIDSDNDEFKLNFSSPLITAFDNYFDRINIRIDNKNPLYNAYVEMDSIRTKYYKISDFSLLNVTTNDTLYVRSEFKGGPQAADFYNLNLYHTIDENRNSVVGINKSELKFKDNLWYLNENDAPDNRIIFDKALKHFNIQNIVMSHENQKIALDGKLEGKTNKDLKLTFENVDLSKVTPMVSRFDIQGDLNGGVNIRQNSNVYQPTASLTVDQLQVNGVELGKLAVDVQGDDSFRKFYVNSTIDNKDIESFSAKGELSIQNKETIADLDLRFNRFNLGSLSSLGGDVITNIHGFTSGTTRIEGNLNDPEINGRLFLDDAGLTIPYLNVNYELEKKSIVDVTETSFIVRNAALTDPKYNTFGVLNGRVRHHNFGDWQLDLDIASDRLLALDTEDSEDAAYYGTAFINGNATITGPTSGLFIKVNAKSEYGTQIKIPINDAEVAGTSSYIHFLSQKEKYNIEKGIVEQARDYNGLELEFDFDITPDAEVEVILDRNTGHGIKGKGFGSLLFKINTLGKFNMWGDFQAYEGVYNFKYGGLIDKRFSVKKGGSITWEGDPMRAVLNIEAIYKTTANPAVLLENASFNKKVPVEVVVGIRGNLSSPEPDFTINFPTVSSVLRSEIQYKLDDKDTRQTQALYLLSSGGFLSAEGVSQSDFAGNFFERASGIFSDLFQDEDGKFVVGIDYVSPDKRPGIETDGRFGFTVSTKVSDRITFNGKVGVPVGGINESAIVGDVEVQYRVNEDGTLNLRVFNRENDINYVIQQIGYTQGIGINYEVDFDTFKEFVNRVFKNMKLDREQPGPAEIMPDSDYFPDYIEMNSGEKKKPETEKVNEEAVPTDD
jgi:hypothetical protein